MNSDKEREVAVLGGGISGLSVAWHLKKAGIPFRLFEKETHTGGMISSDKVGNTVLDYGPNSLRDRTGELRKLTKELGLEQELLEISEAFKTRYVVRHKKLQALKPSPASLAGTKLLSGKAKLRILAEPFIRKGGEGDESIGAFLERRIGTEAVRYLVDPIFSGIYAGDIYTMSKEAILPKLADLEREYGSLLWGGLRSKREDSKPKPVVLSFRKGIQQLTDALTAELKDAITYDGVRAIEKKENGYMLQTAEGSYTCTELISCVPAHTLAYLLNALDKEVAHILRGIEYAPMLSTQLVMDPKKVGELPHGFGFLVPRTEGVRLLGAIWKSEIFPELSEEGKLHFTLMTGGAHDHGVRKQNVEEVEAEILDEFKKLMGITSEPEWMNSRLWEQAIPQFRVGYNEQVQKPLDAFEAAHPDLYIGGNFRWGVSVPDCIEGARKLAEQISR